MSTHDLLDDKAAFLLLANPAGQAWCEAAKTLAAERGIALCAVRIAPDGDAIDSDRRWAALSGVGPDGAVLVRPDGMVAWRSNSIPRDPAAALRRVFDTLLGPRA